ncbi:hypothetical protein CKAH01_05278 [Colletotrichum kahawae]|uniref:Uncharacterized protein n=1 Tax=Colletotrichum kahawae TaxID=34407 RepID=A0AAD9YFV8_COLKA|nr:hypothetical protein CKAH01_05278 [Colletotrichum kahawae]
MPGITQLEIYDEPRTGRDKIMSWNANSYHSLLSNLSERCMVPLKWEDHDYLGNEPVLMMFDVSAVRRLLVHLGTAGSRLTRLSIKTSAPRDFTGLKCEANEQAALQALAENLQHLHFWTGTQKENKLRSGKELLAVSSFIGLLNSKPNLQVLDMDFEGMMKARIRSHHYTPILSKTPRKPLKKLVLRNANLSATAFGEFLANLNSSLDLVITGCEMADGTWGELMDTMKELADPARPSGERLRLLAFRDLSGAEIDTLGKRAQKIFDEARGRLTSGNGKKLSLAHAYVLQMCGVVANPLKKRDIAQILDSN